MTELLTIKDVANLMGVTAKTIRRREKEGKIQSIRTPGGHRRFDKEELLKLMEKETLTVAYLRVNSDKQQEQLQKQLTILEAYRNRTNYNWEIIQDIGNGTNYHNQGLRRLLNLLCKIGRAHV